MKFFDEFKQFIARGNVMDMAVGVVIGTAFTNIVTSFSSSIVNPIIGLFAGKIDIQDLSLKISDSLEFTYGQFLQAVIDFLIMAFVVFCMVKAVNTLMNKLSKKKDEEPEKAPEPSKEELLLTEIRDLLKQRMD